MRGDVAEIQGQISSFYAKHGASPDEVAQAVLKAIDKRKLIVAVPHRQVTLPYLLHRISPRLVQPLARNMVRIVKRG
jgi:short-subunit dehydrogenase